MDIFGAYNWLVLTEKKRNEEYDLLDLKGLVNTIFGGIY